MQHPDEGTIHAWLDGQLPAGEAAELDAHVASCSECAARVAEARGLIAASSRIVTALDVTPGGVIPIDSRRPQRRFRLTPLVSAIAATLVLAAGALLVQEQRKVSLAEDAMTVSPGTEPVIVPGAVARPPRAPDTLAARQSRTVPVLEPGRMGPRPQPAIASTRKIAAPPPRVAALPAPSAAQVTQNLAAEMRADSTRADKAAQDRMREQRAFAGAAAGMSGGSAISTRSARAAAPAAAMPDRKVLVEDRSPASMLGCYETNESTDVLPRRFALADDGQLQYVDSTGKKDGVIRGTDWIDRGGGLAVIRSGGNELLAIRRVTNELVAESPKVARSVRSIPCR